MARPPSAHVRCFSQWNGGPHEAVIKHVRDEAGINIEIDAPAEMDFGRGATPIAVPFFAQSEDQRFREGHAIHHDFYYLGRVADGSSKNRPRGYYQWTDMSSLGSSHLPRIPNEMKKIIDVAFEPWEQRDRL